MKNIKLLAILVASTMILAGCNGSKGSEQSSGSGTSSGSDISVPSSGDSDSFPVDAVNAFKAKYGLSHPVPTNIENANGWSYEENTYTDDTGTFGYLEIYAEDSNDSSNLLEVQYKTLCESAGWTIDDSEYETYGYYALYNGDEDSYLNFYDYQSTDDNKVYFDLIFYGPYLTSEGTSSGTSEGSSADTSGSESSGGGDVTSFTSGTAENEDGSVTATLSSNGKANGEAFSSEKEGAVTFAAAKGTGNSNPVTVITDEVATVRIYYGNTFSISVDDGYTISKIVVTLIQASSKSKTFNDSVVSVSGGTLSASSDGLVGTITGISGTVTISLSGTSGHIAIVGCQVTYK